MIFKISDSSKNEKNSIRDTLIKVDSGSRTIEKEVIDGRSVDSYVKQFSTTLSDKKLNLAGDKYNWIPFVKDVYFEVGGQFARNSLGTCKTAYVTDTITKKSATVTWMLPEKEYYNYLTDQFKKDLLELEPADLFEKYGTHFFRSVVLGGKIQYTANIKALQDKVEAKHNDYLAIKNLYDEKTAGMEKEKAEKAHKKLFVELKAKEAEYENMVTKIADLEQAIKTKTFKIFVGIRPEGFIYDPNGVLSLKTNHVEVMGRDKTIVSVHEESVKPTVRTIVEADLKLPEGATSLKFNLKPNKFFLFDGETEERLR